MPRAPDIPAPSGPSRLGARLRAQRQALGWTLQEAAQASGVRADYLTAIERGRTEDLPPVGYVLGYVRSYAGSLGLDAAASVAAFKAETANATVRRPRGVPHFVPTRTLRLPSGTLPALGAVAAVMLLGAFYGTRLDRDDAAGAPDDDAATAQPDADAALPDTVVSLRANAPSWVSIRDADGRLVVNRVFITEERWLAPRGEAFSVSVRDGGAVELWVGGRSLGPLGKTGEPVADFALGAVQ